MSSAQFVSQHSWSMIYFFVGWKVPRKLALQMRELCKQNQSGLRILGHRLLAPRFQLASLLATEKDFTLHFSKMLKLNYC